MSEPRCRSKRWSTQTSWEGPWGVCARREGEVKQGEGGCGCQIRRGRPSNKKTRLAGSKALRTATRELGKCAQSRDPRDLVAGRDPTSPRQSCHSCLVGASMNVSEARPVQLRRTRHHGIPPFGSVSPAFLNCPTFSGIWTTNTSSVSMWNSAGPAMGGDAEEGQEAEPRLPSGGGLSSKSNPLEGRKKQLVQRRRPEAGADAREKVRRRAEGKRDAERRESR